MSEHRRSPRRDVRVEFWCRDESGLGSLVFDSADLSAGGAFLVSDVLFERGEALTLSFTLPGGSTIRCDSRIAWVRRCPDEGQPPGMGVEFKDLADFDHRALEAFLEG